MYSIWSSNLKSIPLCSLLKLEVSENFWPSSIWQKDTDKNVPYYEKTFHAWQSYSRGIKKGTLTDRWLDFNVPCLKGHLKKMQALCQIRKNHVKLSKNTKHTVIIWNTSEIEILFSRMTSKCNLDLCDRDMKFVLCTLAHDGKICAKLFWNLPNNLKVMEQMQN